MIRDFMYFTCLFVGTATAFASTSNCGDVYKVDIGPWDYADPANHPANVAVVERRHFTAKVENLISGESTSEIMPDLAYTLSKFPNHYRALYSLIRYDEKRNGSLPQIASYKYPFTQSVECYFERAFQFRPEDAKLYQLYGIYFFKKEDYEKAMDNFKKSQSLLPSAELDYNIGLVYFEMNDLENAKLYAEKAYAADFPMEGLKNKLLDKGIQVQ